MKHPREIFTGLLEVELIAAGYDPTETDNRFWPTPVCIAVRNTMQHSPVLFSSDAVAGWLKCREDVLRARMQRGVHG